MWYTHTGMRKNLWGSAWKWKFLEQKKTNKEKSICGGCGWIKNSLNWPSHKVTSFCSDMKGCKTVCKCSTYKTVIVFLWKIFLLPYQRYDSYSEPVHLIVRMVVKNHRCFNENRIYIAYAITGIKNIIQHKTIAVYLKNLTFFLQWIRFAKTKNKP